MAAFDVHGKTSANHRHDRIAANCGRSPSSDCFCYSLGFKSPPSRIPRARRNRWCGHKACWFAEWNDLPWPALFRAYRAGKSLHIFVLIPPCAGRAQSSDTRPIGRGVAVCRSPGPCREESGPSKFSANPDAAGSKGAIDQHNAYREKFDNRP